MFNKLATELGSILLGSGILHIIMGYFDICFWWPICFLVAKKLLNHILRFRFWNSFIILLINMQSWVCGANSKVIRFVNYPHIHRLPRLCSRCVLSLSFNEDHSHCRRKRINYLSVVQHDLDCSKMFTSDVFGPNRIF